jgi:nitrite reductase/ring-hydroxylating ferredoxin subunit
VNADERKAEVRRRINLLKYPRRSKTLFTEANNHNPTVLQDCPSCGGTGHVGGSWLEGGMPVEADYVCPACGGSGITGEAEPYFSTDWPLADAEADDGGWVTCPRCGWRFTIRDGRAWTGHRHLRCGQRISVCPPPGRAGAMGQEES